MRSTDILHRYGIAEEFAPFALVMNWRSYVEDRGLFERLHADDSELVELRRLRIGSFGRRQSITPPTRPLNLITVYLEGFQANLAEHGPVPGLTPQLDRFAAHAVRFDNFYNAVTPTINALISSQCGILAEIENSDLRIDRGYTRNLRCLSDRLHEAGYYQVFMGGADSQFSGKRLFLTVHQYDEVWGWEQWKEQARYAVGPHNDWGLHDTDLVREALARVRQLRDRGPFHLSLLTVNTHPPGFLAPDCPSSDFASAFLQAVSCTDFAVGLLLDGLERDGVLDDTVVVLMGDHTVLPSPENATALGPLAVGWFDKVYMALRYPGADPRVITTPSYTPDMAPTLLDALNFSPVPRFAFGQSTLRADRRPTLVAHHFQILGNRLLIESPALATQCNPTELEHTRIGLGDQRLSACERERIVRLVEKAQVLHLPLRRSRSAQ